jgi:hypothetical protein
VAFANRVIASIRTEFKLGIDRLLPRMLELHLTKFWQVNVRPCVCALQLRHENVEVCQRNTATQESNRQRRMIEQDWAAALHDP